MLSYASLTDGTTLVNTACSTDLRFVPEQTANPVLMVVSAARVFYVGLKLLFYTLATCTTLIL